MSAILQQTANGRISGEEAKTVFSAYLQTQIQKVFEHSKPQTAADAVQQQAPAKPVT